MLHASQSLPERPLDVIILPLLVTLVAQIARSLQPGGELRVASDVEEYFTLIQHLIAALPPFQEQTIPELSMPQHSLDYLTNFERKYRLEGRPIFRAHYRLEFPGSDG